MMFLSLLLAGTLAASQSYVPQRVYDTKAGGGLISR